MKTYRVTRKSDGSLVYEYQADLPQPEHLTDEYRVEEVSDAYIAPHEPEAEPDTRMFAGRRRLTKLEFATLLGAGFISILAAAKTNVEAEAWVKLVELATPDPDGYSIDLDDPRIARGLSTFEALGAVAAGTTERVLHG